MPSRHDYPQLSNAHWDTMERMVSVLDRKTFVGLYSLSAEKQRAQMERFGDYGSILFAHVNKTAQEAARAVIRSEVQSAALTLVTYTLAQRPQRLQRFPFLHLMGRKRTAWSYRSGRSRSH